MSNSLILATLFKFLCRLYDAVFEHFSNMHVYYLGILLQCRLVRSELGPELL